jgi:TonB family protein
MNPARCVVPFLAVLAVIAPAQSPAPAAGSSVQATPGTPSPHTAPQSDALPTDPAALLSLAAQQNGLHGAKLQPWHAHATFRATSPQGEVSQQGTVEEWWAGENLYKLILSSGNAQRIIYSTSHGRVAVKSDANLPVALGSVEALALWPIPDPTPEQLRHSHLEIVPAKTAEHAFTCVLQTFLSPDGRAMAIRNASGKLDTAITQYCFDQGSAILRTRTDRFGTWIFNSVERFQGQYVAREVDLSWAAGAKWNVTFDTLEVMPSLNSADVTPAADAVLVPYALTVPVSAGVMAGDRIAGDAPPYPEDAERNLIQGTVVLQALILKDGTVGDLSVISGPAPLQQPALNAVKTWCYAPYWFQGQPVDVRTQINVVFQLHR